MHIKIDSKSKKLQNNLTFEWVSTAIRSLDQVDICCNILHNCQQQHLQSEYYHEDISKLKNE